MSIIIKPSIGRKVWFYKSAQHRLDCHMGHDQPYDATVVFVHNDRHVNLRVTDHLGSDSPAVGVDLVQPSDTLEVNGPHAAWMDYQVLQELARAVKESLEKSPGWDTPMDEATPVYGQLTEAAGADTLFDVGVLRMSDGNANDEALHNASAAISQVSAEMQYNNVSNGTVVAVTDDATGRLTFPKVDDVEIDTTAKQVESLSEQSDTAGNVPFAAAQSLGEPL